MLDPSESFKLDQLDELIRDLLRLRNEWKTRLDEAAKWKDFEWRDHEGMMYVSFIP